MMIFKVTVGSGIGLVLGVWLVGTEYAEMTTATTIAVSRDLVVAWSANR